MKNVRRRLMYMVARLYPGAWRERYGEEFAAMVEQMPEVRWGAVVDTAKAALLAQARSPETAKFTLLCAAAGLLFAAAGSWTLPNRYRSMAALKLAGSDASGLDKAIDRSLSPEQLRVIAEKHGLPIGVERMQGQIRVEGPRKLRNGGAAFRIAFDYGDAATAQRVTRDLTQSIIAGHGSGSLSVLDSASRPQQPITPNRKVIALTGGVTGALAGLAWALLRRARRPA